MPYVLDAHSQQPDLHRFNVLAAFRRHIHRVGTLLLGGSIASITCATGVGRG